MNTDDFGIFGGGGGATPADAVTAADAAIAPPDADIPMAALAAAPAVRFCRACGAPWQPTWTECVPCRSRAATAVAPPPLRMPTDDLRPIKSALALYFAMLAASAVGLCAIIAHADPAATEITLSSAHSLIVLGWCAFNWRAILPPLVKVPNPLWLLGGVGLGCVTFLLASGSMIGLHRLLDVKILRMSESFLHAGYGWGTVVLWVCVQPAIFEELAFRGVVISALHRALSPMESVWVSALLFMILHLTPAGFPYLFVLGVVLGLLRVRTGSLLPGMLLHFTHNLLCVAAEHGSLGPFQ